MIELTEHQRQAFRETGWPPEVQDPQTGETYVLIPKAMFERARALLEAEDEIAAVEEMYPLAGEVLDGDSVSRESA